MENREIPIPPPTGGGPSGDDPDNRRLSSTQGDCGSCDSPFVPFSSDDLLRSGAKQILLLFYPVTIAMLLTIISAKTLTFYQSSEFYPPIVIFSVTDGEDAATTAWKSVTNVAVIMAGIIVMTFVLFLLFKYECYKCLQAWMVFTTITLLFFLASIFLRQVLKSFDVFADYISFAFVIWNFGMVGMIAVHWRAPLVVRQGYLIFISIQLALYLLKYLPRWTCWVLLGALTIWDLVAVLCPGGPLRMLIEVSQQRDKPLMPALLYSTTAAYTVVAADAAPETRDQNPGPNASYGAVTQNIPLDHIPDVRFAGPVASEAERRGEDDQPGAEPRADASEEPIDWREVHHNIRKREESGFMLGLGDFVFYSLLMGRATIDSDGVTALACYVAILVGMCTTIIILAVLRKPLPALPISIACGILFYFTASLVMSPFADAMFQQRIYF